MTAADDREKPTMSMLAMYDGRVCTGFLMLRGRDGVEAFDANARSIGLFKNLKAASAAVSEQGPHAS